MQKLQHDHLKDLAKQLPTIAVQSRQQGTVRNYINGFSRWRKWAANFPEICAFPAEPAHAALYLLDLYNKSETHAPVSLGFYSLSWAHRLAGIADPTDSVLVKSVKEAASRVLGHGTNQKQPITSDIIKDIIDFHVKTNSSFADLRAACICIIAFAGFLRFDELIRIKFSDIHFGFNHVKIFIESSKTDIYREGCWVFISSLQSKYCPVKILKRYLLAAKFFSLSDKYIFRAITRH